MNVRLYKKSEDLSIILNWYRSRKQIEPYANMFTEESTFILENEDKRPIMCVSVYLTNSKEIALLEHLICDPDFKGYLRNVAIKMITNHAERFTKELGYKRLITLINKESLKNKYASYGYKENSFDLSLFVKELSGE